MISICYSYSCRWRYQYNSDKCAVVVFNESKNAFRKSNRTWYMGNYVINETAEIVHLVLLSNTYCDSKSIVQNSSKTLRRTFFGISKYGLNVNGFNPINRGKIYKSVVLPKAFIWTELIPFSNNDMILLERSHRLCLKRIQGMHMRSRTNVVLGLMSCLPIESEIEKRKLNLFGQFCTLVNDSAAKTMFLIRLCSYMSGVSTIGFIVDIFIILHKYDCHKMVKGRQLTKVELNADG